MMPVYAAAPTDWIGMLAMVLCGVEIVPIIFSSTFSKSFIFQGIEFMLNIVDFYETTFLKFYKKFSNIFFKIYLN